MAINQVQLQCGFSMAEFIQRFGSDEACRRAGSHRLSISRNRK